MVMKMKHIKAAGFICALAASGLLYVEATHGQQSTGSTAHPETTNWIGYLVVGQNETSDRIAIGGPHPAVERQVEIGLRSDGTVIWRRSPNGK
jgi:hypothetical protein